MDPRIDPSVADAFLLPDAAPVDQVVPLDSGLDSMPTDSECLPSDGVCDGLDTDCDGERDDSNVCSCGPRQSGGYFLCSTLVDWHTALLACEARGGSLAVIENSQQNEQVRVLVLDFEEFTGAWIGLNDIEVENRHQWHTMNPAEYRAWRSGMPDNSGGEDCIEAQINGWNDLDCDARRPFICQHRQEN